MNTTRFIRDIPLEKITIARLENLLSTVIKVNECRLRLNPHHTGYTYLNVGGTKYTAHRITKTVATGLNSSHLVVDHLCRNRSCVRVSHLEFVTHDENIRRGSPTNYKKELCKYGHPLKDARSTVTPKGYIHRSCRPCHAREEAARRRRQHAKEIN